MRLVSVADGRRAEVADGRHGAEVADMQRRRLLLAIGEVLAEQGLEAATVGRVCARAGVSRRTFYELFEDREACLAAAFEHAVERLARELEPAYRGVAGERSRRWRERVRAALAVLLARFDVEPELACLCVVQAPRAGPVVNEMRGRVLEALVSVIDEGREEARTSSQPPPLTAQGVVGGVLAVLHAHMNDTRHTPMVSLINELAAMIVHPYLGAAAARRERERSAPDSRISAMRTTTDPFRGLPIRFTYRTVRVLAAIAEQPGASNRDIAECSGIADEGQMSRLLRRLHESGLIQNLEYGHQRGEPNAWKLTERGQAIHTTIAAV